MKKIIFGLSLFVVSLLLSGCFVADSSPYPELTEEEKVNKYTADMEEAIKEQAKVNTVTITAEGFSPKTLTITEGTTVTFTNGDSNNHWPASAMHPTHTVYPGSDIKKCGSDETIFDACKGLGQGELFSFTFNEKGSWKYHDHLSVSSTGTIVVE